MFTPVSIELGPSSTTPVPWMQNVIIARFSMPSPWRACLCVGGSDARPSIGFPRCQPQEGTPRGNHPVIFSKNITSVPTVMRYFPKAAPVRLWQT
jgi:hypothetical protein